MSGWLNKNKIKKKPGILACPHLIPCGCKRNESLLKCLNCLNHVAVQPHLELQNHSNKLQILC